MCPNVAALVVSPPVRVGGRRLVVISEHRIDVRTFDGGLWCQGTMAPVAVAFIDTGTAEIIGLARDDFREAEVERQLQAGGYSS